MNVSATTLVANTAKAGSTTIDRSGTITNGKITTIRVSGDTTIHGETFVKTELSGPTITTLNEITNILRERNLVNISDIDILSVRNGVNEQSFQNVSGEFQLVLQNEFPTTEKVSDLSGRVGVNEDTIVDLSQEIYLLEIANEGGYPSDAEQIALETIHNRNVSDSDILFIRVYGVKDDALDGAFADQALADAIEERIVTNEGNISDASAGYYYAFNNASTLVTQANYDDLSERAIDVSNTIALYIDDPNLFGYNDVSNREGDLSEAIGEYEPRIHEYTTDLSEIRTRITDLSNTISITNERVMIGVSASEYTGDQSGVIIGEESMRNHTYINANITSIRGETTISDTAVNLIQPKSKIDTDFVDISRDVSSIVVDFSSKTPYAPTYHIILDPSEGLISEPTLTFPYGNTSLDPLLRQSDGGIALDIRISRLSKSRRLLVTIPPATASRLTIGLYDDDSFGELTRGYDISDERCDVMNGNLGYHYTTLTGEQFDGGAKMYNSIHVSPACAPAIDVSFLGLNATQKTNLIDHLLPDRIQYHHNPTNTKGVIYEGGSLYHLIHNISDGAYGDPSGIPGTDLSDFKYVEFLTEMNLQNNINKYILENGFVNLSINGLPSFLINQPIYAENNGNKIDFLFGGASRLIHDSIDSSPGPGIDPNSFSVPPLTNSLEIASPFDYYGGNSYTFEIHIVSTGRPEHRDLAKVYITEKTRETSTRRFYNSRHWYSTMTPNPTGQPLTGPLIKTQFLQYKSLRKQIYQQLNPNPSLI